MRYLISQAAVWLGEDDIQIQHFEVQNCQMCFDLTIVSNSPQNTVFRLLAHQSKEPSSSWPCTLLNVFKVTYALVAGGFLVDFWHCYSDVTQSNQQETVVKRDQQTPQHSSSSSTLIFKIYGWNDVIWLIQLILVVGAESLTVVTGWCVYSISLFLSGSLSLSE